MHTLRRFVCFVPAFLILFGGGVLLGEPVERMIPIAASEPIPARDFVRSVYNIQPPTINRAGTYLADLHLNSDGVFQLAIEDLVTGAVRYLPGGTWIRWATDESLFYNIRGRIHIVDAGTGEVTRNYQAYPMLGMGTNKEPPAYAWVRRDADGPLRIDVMTGLADTRASEPPDGTCTGYYADKDGDLAFAMTADNGVMSLERLDGERWRRCPVDLDRINPIGPGDKPGELIILGPLEKGRPRAVQRLDSVSGRPGPVIYQDNGYDFAGGQLVRSRESGKVIGLRFIRGGPETVWLEPDLASLQRRIDVLFPGKIAQIIEFDDARRLVIVSENSDRDPGGYYLADLKTGSIRDLRRIGPWIDPARMRPMRRVSYLARDGAQIEGFLTMPAEVAGRRPPLLVAPHDGPWKRDFIGCNGFAQFFASRGYAVFQPNYRGSTGYDWRFSEADRWDFSKMRDDVTDGTKFMIQSGLVDPNRIAIAGYGFGGYLAICGATFEPDLYRCAATIGGSFDWGKIVRASRTNLLSDNVAYDTLRRHLGDPGSQAAKYDAISPLRHVNKIRIPILVCHGVLVGAYRRVVTPSESFVESEQLLKLLKANHIPNRDLAIGGRGHGYSAVDSQVDIITGLEEFLDENMKASSSAGSDVPPQAAIAAR